MKNKRYFLALGVFLALLLILFATTKIHADSSEDSIAMLARLIYGEGRGLNKYEKSLIAWNVYNRVDDPRFPDTLKEVITQPHQYSGYSPKHPIDPECYEIAEDVSIRYSLEHQTGYDYGRTLPKKYISFWGDGKHNYFRTTDKKDIYDFSLPDPYKTDKEAIK